eukprot:scaffold388551_cov26-Prasinocladus_malaysianus.AAC.1
MPEPNSSGFALHVLLQFVVWGCPNLTKVKPGSLLCRRNQLTADVYEMTELRNVSGNAHATKPTKA